MSDTSTSCNIICSKCGIKMAGAVGYVGIEPCCAECLKRAVNLDFKEIKDQTAREIVEMLEAEIPEAQYKYRVIDLIKQKYGV